MVCLGRPHSPPYFSNGVAVVVVLIQAVGYDISFEWLADNVKAAQDYLLQNTTLGIPALVQTEGTAPNF